MEVIMGASDGRLTHPESVSEPGSVATAARWRSFDNEFHEVADLRPLIAFETVKHAKPLYLVVDESKTRRERFDAVVRPNLDDPQSQGLHRLDFRKGQAAEGVDAIPKTAVGFAVAVLRRENEPIHLATEANGVEPERPLIASRGRGRGRKAIDHQLLDRALLDILDPAGVEILDQGLLGGVGHDIKPQRLRRPVLEAENGLCGVVQHEALGCLEREAELRMEESPAPYIAVDRILAIDQPIEISEIGRPVALAGPLTGILPRRALGVPDALRSGGMRG